MTPTIERMKTELTTTRGPDAGRWQPARLLCRLAQLLYRSALSRHWKISNVPAFYSAAALPHSTYTLWVFAAVDGSLHWSMA